MAPQLTATARNFLILFKKNNVTFPISDEMLNQFGEFYRFLMEYDKKYNLTRLKSFQQIAIKHFVDCIYVAQLTDIPPTLMDMGTGAGFPGIPLKIILPETRIILAEGVQKKVEYLKELREHMNFEKLDIIGRNVTPDMHYPVDGVITRAVEVVTDTLRNTVNCLKPSGKVFLMKTPGIDEEIEKAEDEMGDIFELVQNTDYQLGQTTHQRKLLVYQKK